MRKGILLNFDGDMEYFFLKYYINGEWSGLEAKAREFLEKYYADNGISDILFNIFCQNSVTPSSVITDRVQKYHQRTENGISVDYTENERLSLPAICREKYNLPLTELWIKHCNKIGIRPWLSIRMNDCHFPDEETAFLRSDFFYEARRNGWTLGDEYGYYKNCLNYTAPEVRKIMLDYIREQLCAIDVYGIELDFMREPKCFDYHNYRDISPIINEFMGKIKEIVTDCENLHGHKIKIMLRLPRDMDFARKIGFDAVYMAQHGLADAVVPSPRWETADTDMPISKWVERLSPYKTEVFPCLEINTPYSKSTDCETAKAHTVQYYSQGASGIYVYNIYHPFLAFPDFPFYSYKRVNEITEIWQTCADYEKCLKGVRRHILTYEDNGFTDFGKPWRPLPKIIGSGADFEIKTGEISEGSTVTVFLGINGEGTEKIRVTLNGIPCRNAAKAEKPFITEKEASAVSQSFYAFTAQNANFPSDIQRLGINGSPECEIAYVELKINS